MPSSANFNPLNVKRAAEQINKGFVQDTQDLTKARDDIDTGYSKPSSTKISKESVLYIYRPETQTQCNVCVWSKDKNHPGVTKVCKVMGPTQPITAYGSCGYWAHMDPTKEQTPELPILGIFTKDQVGYAENKMGFTCKRCVNFLLNGDCKKVDKDSRGDTPGIISPNGCCNAWEKDPIRSKLNTEQLMNFLDRKVK